MSNIQHFHTSLLLKRPWGLIVAYSTVVILVMTISGVYLWWKRKLFTIRGQSFWRFNFDFHNAVGLYLTPFLLAFTVTGIAISFEWPRQLLSKLNPAGQQQLGPKPISISTPGKRRLPLDQQIAAAQTAAPNLRFFSVQIPRVPKIPVTVTMVSPNREAGDKTFQLISVDPYTNQVMRAWQQDRNRGTGAKIISFMVPVHTGRIGPLHWPVQLAYLLASLMTSVVSLSGVLIWWKRAVL
jgi:uncharacterized iron-regulated membrane protein